MRKIHILLIVLTVLIALAIVAAFQYEEQQKEMTFYGFIDEATVRCEKGNGNALVYIVVADPYDNDSQQYGPFNDHRLTIKGAYRFDSSDGLEFPSNLSDKGVKIVYTQGDYKDPELVEIKRISVVDAQNETDALDLEKILRQHSQDTKGTYYEFHFEHPN